MIRTTIRILVLLVACIVLVADWNQRADAAIATPYVLVANPKISESSLTRSEVKQIFLGRKSKWSDGSKIHAVDLSTKSKTRYLFTKEVLKMTLSSVQSYWRKAIFAGTGAPPPMKKSSAAIVAHVTATPGAIGYIKAGIDPGSAKIIQISK